MGVRVRKGQERLGRVQLPSVPFEVVAAIAHVHPIAKGNLHCQSYLQAVVGPRVVAESLVGHLTMLLFADFVGKTEAPMGEL